MVQGVARLRENARAAKLRQQHENVNHAAPVVCMGASPPQHQGTGEVQRCLDNANELWIAQQGVSCLEQVGMKRGGKVQPYTVPF